MVPFGHYRAFLLSFGIMLALSLTVVGALTHYKIKSDVRQMEYLAATKSNEIIEAVYALLYKAEALSTLVIQGDGEVRDFERIAPIIINSPAIRNILLAPGGVVNNVFPMTGNSILMGYNLLGPGEGNEEARLAQKTKSLTLGGPFNAVQGGQVLVGRIPVFTAKDGDETFWGLTSVTLNYPEALHPVRLIELENLGYACEIWRINPDRGGKQVILRTRDIPLESAVEKDFHLLNALWTISIGNLNPWYKTYVFYAMLAGALLFSLLCASIIQNYSEMRQIRASLEYLAVVDPLTDLPNRRAVLDTLKKRLRECEKKRQNFLLAYLDLDGFKAVNDTYGHSVGDAVLCQVAQRLKDLAAKGAFAGRIGGDEFILILKQDKEDPERQRVAIRQALEGIDIVSPALPQGEMRMSFSMGFASYPENGASIDTLMAHADAAMYRSKEEKRS